MIDPSGVIRARYDYDPYGKQTKLSGDLEADFGFTGFYHYHVSPPDLYFALYRVYAPDTGRWLNRDPIGEAGGLNLYGYVRNNPVNGRDAFGLIDDAGYPEISPQATSDFANSTVGILQSLGSLLDNFASDALRYPGTGVMGGELEGPLLRMASEADEALLDRLMNYARGLYPKLCRKVNKHHIDPKYIGGDPKGPTVRLEAPYHQLITNAFRDQWGYGQSPPPANLKANIINTVYYNFPLPK
jgi:RHS repeat-associated protein